jgi:type IV pilus biogenesis protein CpaD/CtpE
LIHARPQRRAAGGLILAAALGLSAGAVNAAPAPAAEPTPALCQPRTELTSKMDAGPSAFVIRGCLNRSNLAAMVANPADLTRGRPLGPADGARQTVPVEAYQKGMAKGLSAGAAAPSGQLLLPAIQTGVQ